MRLFRNTIRLIALTAVISSHSVQAAAPTIFNKYFADKTLRIDINHSGTKGEEHFSPDVLYEEGLWAGSMVNLVDTLNLGEYLCTMSDAATHVVIYSRGYSTMFNEWQTTDEAASGKVKTFQESFRLPFPKQKIQIQIFRRNKQMEFMPLYAMNIDPERDVIHKEKPNVTADVIPLLRNGDVHQKVDIVILADGYTKDEKQKFIIDAKHFSHILFGTRPFKDHEKDFNVTAVAVESGDTGIDQPDKDIWARNSLGTTYNTFGSARYILTEDNRAVRDYASLVPYDFIALLVNNNRYGGGGIFQLYSTCFSTGETPATAWQADYVFVHEFGHLFAGLGDEYYSSSVAYTDFYVKGIEPWEPNIAAYSTPAELKWRDLVDTQTPLPTPWNKSAYDSIEAERAKLKRSDVNYAEKRQRLIDQGRGILETQKFKNTVGAFEGAGYTSTGLFRPSVDCRMFSLSLVDFDPVCSRAIERMIDFYTK